MQLGEGNGVEQELMFNEDLENLYSHWGGRAGEIGTLVRRITHTHVWF